MARPQSVLGLKTLTALVIANMIGAGVFTTSGFSLADLGSPWRVLAAWLIGGLLALAGALSYGALARLVPESGGEYRYLAVNLHPAVGFVAGWVSLLAGFTGAIAFAALAFAGYAAPLTGEIEANLLATVIIVVAALLHALRLRPGAWLQNAAVALKLVCMAALCVLAVFSTPWQGLSEIVEGAYAVPPFSIAAFALSSVWISYSYLGFNAAVYLAGEVPSAQTLVPKALLLGTVLTVLLYLALNAVFVLVPTFDGIAGREDVATAAAVALGGDWLAGAVRGLVALALFTSISAMLMIGPRVYARMAEDRLAPQFLSFSGETPTSAIVAQAALAAAVVWITDLRQLLSYLGFTLGLSAAAAVVSLFVIARRNPERVRGLTGYPWAPAVYVGFALLFSGLAATQNPVELVAALVTIFSGLLLYTVLRRIYQ
jgi:APA family basic amino acid/polyamine antiporter